MHPPAKVPNDLEKFFVERANAGDVEGLVALYEASAVVAHGNGEVAMGRDQIREFFAAFLAAHPKLDPSIQAAALCSGDLALTSSRLRNGDVTAEVARRQPDGRWLWVVDQFAINNEVGDDPLARSWVSAWNQRDVDAVAAHYADDVEFQSPLVVKLLGEQTGTVRGKESLREYFQKALAAFPDDLQIVLLGTYRGVNSRLVHFEVNGRRGVEVMELDSNGKIRRAMTLGES